MKTKLLLAFAALAVLLYFPLAAQVPDDHPDVDARIQDTDHDGDLDADVDVDTHDRDGDFDADVEVDTKDANVKVDNDTLADDDDAAAIDSDRDELPRTASPLPLIALLGAGSVLSALGLRVTRR